MGLFKSLKGRLGRKEKEMLAGGNDNTADSTAKANQKPSLDELLKATPTYDNIREAIWVFMDEASDLLMFAYDSTREIYSKESQKINEMARALDTLAHTMFMSYGWGNIQSDDEIQKYADGLKIANSKLKKTRECLDRMKKASKAEAFRQNKSVPEGDRRTTDSYQMDDNSTIEQTNDDSTGWDVSDI